MTGPLLEIRGLAASYGRAQVLFGLDLAVASGQVVALVGRNGAGKSTTFRAVMGLLPASAERLAFRGARPPARAARPGRRSGSLPSSPTSPRCAAGAATPCRGASSRCSPSPGP